MKTFAQPNPLSRPVRDFYIPHWAGDNAARRIFANEGTDLQRARYS